MSPLVLTYPTTASLEYPNTAEPQENDLKINFIKMLEVLKEEINKSLKKKRLQKKKVKEITP